MTHLWFKARRYGWGWTPVSIEGWLVLIAFLVLVFVSAGFFVYRVRMGADVRYATILFVLWLTFLGGVLITVAWITGERPRWRWGD